MATSLADPTMVREGKSAKIERGANVVTSGEKKMGYRHFMGDNPSLYHRIIKHDNG